MLNLGHKALLIPVLTLCLAAAGGCKKTAPRLERLDSDLQRFSYAMGMDMGSFLREQVGELDSAAFRQGLDDARRGQPLLLTDEEANTIKQTEGQRRHEAKLKENEEKSRAYLEANGKKPGVTTTASGLQFEVLQAAEGPKPAATSKVTVHYTGTLIDSTEFDSSVKRGQPASFALSGVIPGWSEGLQLMSTGSKYRFTIPPALGYGSRGAGNIIPPNAVLIFEVELISIDESMPEAPEGGQPK